jgi:putative FmdB family regulatory protein
MPIYEYACEHCETVTEKLESITSENKEIECPNCGETAQRIMSASAFHLKGGGWYSQGYNKSSAPSCGSASDSSPACKSCPAAKA